MKDTRGLLWLKRLTPTLAVFALLFLLLSIASEVASAQVAEEWVERYNPGIGGYTPAAALAVDTVGNVYVTGVGATIKYDSNGNPLWVASRGGGGGGLAVDSAGNVFVTGLSTAKYDSNGKELWVTTLEGWAITVDAVGNVYVTNGSYTAKADSDGNTLWIAGRGGRRIAVDAAGNVYVAGTSTGLDGRGDYATTKYDNDGNELWVATYSFSHISSPAAIAVDAVGNVYVTGTSADYDTLYNDFYSHYFTVKYDANGNELWHDTYNHPRTLYEPQDQAVALALDTSGNVLVTGGIRDLDTSYDYATIKYDVYGSVVWAARYNGPANGWDFPAAIAVDAADSVYVTGKSSAVAIVLDRGDYATVKYDSNGNELWVHRYNGPGNGEDGAVAIAVDAASNVYVTGGSTGSDGTYDYATIKLTSDNNATGGGGSSSGGGGGGGCFIEAVLER
jgi:hypothetical protein